MCRRMPSHDARWEVPDARWEAFAAREPYFSVLTAPKFLRANVTPDREREFFDSGEQLVDWMLRTIDLRVQAEFAPMTILEYGCGVGRLALPFAKTGAAVVAVDRSPAMLDIARREAQRRDLEHIAFLTPGALFNQPRKFDLVSCYLVLQRMPPREGLALFRALLGLLGPGGIAVVHVPHRAIVSKPWRDATRQLRQRVPMINSLANRLRGKSADEPFVPTHLYDIGSVVRMLDEAGIRSTHLLMQDEDDLASTVMFLQAPGAAPRKAAPASQEPIVVRALIARTSLDDLHRSAEEYFATLTDWDHHLAKPFSKPDDTPPLLMDMVTLLQGLRLTPGMTVLEFGAGTGWLSRFITQLGCRAILLDVSPTALKIAQELYARLPVIGQQPEPRFLPFDGRRIDLPDASVDRIVSFHAFHHAANPDEMLAEFARVLRPGGVAGFAEPGPRHSRTPLSQFEMRTYAVVENDIDIHAIWRTAQRCGFTDGKLAVFHTPPFHVSIEEFSDLLAGGPTCDAWVESTRAFLRHVRTFFLIKSGAGAADSRSAAGLACRIVAALADGDADARSHADARANAAAGADASTTIGRPILIDASVTNSGAATWLPSNTPLGGVLLGAHVYDSAGTRLTFDASRQALADPPREIPPGATVHVRLTVPPLPAGSYVIELDCVAEGVLWFAQAGSAPAAVRVTVRG
jgi:SAM-dependent methyltransferase